MQKYSKFVCCLSGHTNFNNDETVNPFYVERSNAMKDEKRKRNSLKIAVTILGSITIIGGASIFGGLSVFQSLFNELKIVIPDPGQVGAVASATPIPNATTEPVPSQNPVEPEPTVVPTQAPISTPITTKGRGFDKEQLKDGGTAIEPMQGEKEEDDTYENDSLDNGQNSPNDNVTEGDNSGETTTGENSSNGTQTIQTQNEDDTNQSSDSQSDAQTLNIDSPGQLLFFSNNASGEGTLAMYYSGNTSSGEQIETDDTDDTAGQNSEAIYNISDLVNDLPDDEAGQENVETVSYINVEPGTYSIVYDFSIELEIYLVDNVDDYFNEEQESDDSQEGGQEEANTVPDSDIKEVVFTEEGFVYSENIVSQYTFCPTIYFDSYEQVDGVLEIVDEYGNSIQSINASELDETHEFTCEFELQEGMRYTIKISSGEGDFTTEPTYYYKISDLSTQE